MADAALARRALRLLDLTDLAEDTTAQATRALCARSLAAPGPVAAICVWPRFVAAARQALPAGPVAIATVVNFPAGGAERPPVLAAIQTALADGADEIDLVLPWRALLAGDEASARAMVAEAKVQCGPHQLKVILESGDLPDQAAVRRAARLAIAAGADFIKTSTGKSGSVATPEAARTMLEEIRASGRPVGLKPSGGLRTLADAACYLELADALMGPGWASPATFRFGASGLHGVLVAAIGTAAPPTGDHGAY